VKGRYKDASWQAIGDELKTLLSPEEYDSAKRTTFNAFYTSPVVIAAIHEAIARLGIPANPIVLEPGCGTGNFLSHAPQGMRFIGVEMDSVSARIARLLHPGHDIRLENFRDTRLPENRIDAVVGNVPFADVKYEHGGQRFSLHDFFFAKSIDVLKVGGALGLVTSHFTLDKQNAAIREYLGERDNFIGAIRLPSDAFKREGTAIVTDIAFLRKRAPSELAQHVDPSWLGVEPLQIEENTVPINGYFLNHPEMVLGSYSGKDSLYGGGYSVVGSGDLAERLRQAIQRLPEAAPTLASHAAEERPAPFTPPPMLPHIGEGSFFVRADRAICQTLSGQAEPVVYGGIALKADGTMTGKRLAALIGLRDRARRWMERLRSVDAYQ
jgi:tRNA G46 methylase TrmB